MTGPPSGPEDAHFVLLDGWQHRRAPVHWQGWLAEQLVDRGASVDYPTLPEPDRPRRAAWAAAVRRAVDRNPPVVVVAHGLSVLLWLGLAADDPPAPLARRALLVAPPAAGPRGGDIAQPLPDGVTAESVRRLTEDASLLVCAPDDPEAPGGADALYGRPLGLATVSIDGGGHLNAGSGFGPWPAALEWCLTAAWPRPTPVGGGAAPAAPGSAAPGPAAGPVVVASGELTGLLATRFRPSGKRLGILTTSDVPAEVDAAAAAALEASGQLPSRRLARLHARPGERGVRPADVADFVERYGHEYAHVVLTGNAEWSTSARTEVVAACRHQGCELVWVDTTSSGHRETSSEGGVSR